ncbi:MAG: Lrp/AsnC family transcriptional regulator [Lewinellaceae bacterium]|nr:Lrp/AsnC family transcriptional regulator [Saprospiraceae bacterium]MCB9317596.1 Lrp/AsnC family transcriptional regulator [Lewinellaceae bacterium]MCB9332934.1 Lrp/AsnC family transcriptional regulator [Lewinellaceae bacterium]
MEKNSTLPDATDRAILQLLQEDAFLTTKEIAAQTQLTTTPVFERIKRLEREGYIARYTALLDRRKIGLTMLVFCDVLLKEHNREYLLRFEESVVRLPEVLECHHVTGEYDYLLKVAVHDMDDYQQFIKEKLAVLENIGRVQSHFVMTEVKNSTVLPVGE